MEVEESAEEAAAEAKMGGEASRGRTWTAEERLRHSNACRSKVRLTQAQKLEIIKLAESEEGERLSQADLAMLYNKVRTAHGCER